jgi:uncharacterized protein
MTDKPSPVADADSQPFWDACRAGRLVAQQCDACGRWRWPPRGICPACNAWAHQWRPLPGTGVIQAFVVPHRAFSPAFAEDVPYVVVHVALDGTDGQVVLVSNLDPLDWQAVSVGMRVAVFFDRSSLPKFQPG